MIIINLIFMNYRYIKRKVNIINDALRRLHSQWTSSIFFQSLALSDNQDIIVRLLEAQARSAF